MLGLPLMIPTRRTGRQRTVPNTEMKGSIQRELYDFLIECIAACALFTAMLEILCAKRREIFTNDYPPVVTEKLRSLSVVSEKPPAKKSDIILKLIAVIIYAVLFAVVLRFVNGITTFLNAAATAYLLWLVVDWYDFLVVDILLAPFDKFYKMAKVSPFEKSAVWFHCKASMRGMILGLVFAPIVGLIVMFI